MTENEKLLTVVVVGKMNPAIHHPFWYHFNKLIDDKQLADSLSNGRLLVVTNPAATFSQFDAGKFAIACQPERWEVKARDYELVEQLVGLTSQIFDTLLPHTPTLSLGINVHLTRAIPGASEAAGRSISQCPLIAGDGGNAVGGGVAVSRTVGPNLETVSVSARPATDEATVAINIHRDTRPSGEDLVFSIGPILKEMASSVAPATERAMSILDRLEPNK